VQYLEGAIQPAEIRLARFRLDAAPGEFADPDMADTGLDHHSRVALPTIFRPGSG
jgi:hypothetical protein